MATIPTRASGNRNSARASHSTPFYGSEPSTDELPIPFFPSQGTILNFTDRPQLQPVYSGMTPIYKNYAKSIQPVPSSDLWSPLWQTIRWHMLRLI